MPQNTALEVIPSVLETRVSVASYRAIQVLKTGKVPPQHIKSHKGKGGKEMLYVSHIRGTATMNDAFDQFWDMEVLRENVYADNSATAAVKVTIYYYDVDGKLFHTRTITELGSREQIDKMPIANVVLGAASRGLLRCMLRAFNYGAELYKDEEEEFTPAIAWRSLEDYAATRKYPKEELVKLMKESKIDKSELVEKFFDIYKLVYDRSIEYSREMEEKAELEKKSQAVAKAEQLAKEAQERAEAARKELDQ